jgi:rod shape-determining protein MreB and related proteins
MLRIPLLKKKSFAIDLGNNNTLVSDQEKVLVDQPSCIVFDREKDAVNAFGHSAYNMFEKTHDELKPVKPLKGGVIADLTSATRLLDALMKEAYGHKTVLNGYENIISGVPYSTTNVEKRALKAALEQFNASSVYLLYEPLAAALGMGLDIAEPEGKMVVDIGGGITEIVVISLSGIASFQSITVAGDMMDEEIQHYFRRKYNMSIGLKTAEQVKIRVGAVSPVLEAAPLPMQVKGKDLMRGIPVTRQIDHLEVCSILEKSISAIELGIIQTLEKCPPELAGDIYHNGIHITGGNAFLRGLKHRLEKKTNLSIHIDPAALHSVSKGVAKMLGDTRKYKSLLLS